MERGQRHRGCDRGAEGVGGEIDRELWRGPQATGKYSLRFRVRAVADPEGNGFCHHCFCSRWLRILWRNGEYRTPKMANIEFKFKNIDNRKYTKAIKTHTVLISIYVHKDLHQMHEDEHNCQFSHKNVGASEFQNLYSGNSIFWIPTILGTGRKWSQPDWCIPASAP